MLKQRLQDDMKAALKAGEKDRLGTVRMINAAIKQREIDERIELDDVAVLAVLEKMIKQRRDAQAQFEQAGRVDLATREAAEIEICQSYLPEPLTETELNGCIDAAIAAAGATSMRDMGKVMAVLKPQVQGRADMGALSSRVKQRLGA